MRREAGVPGAEGPAVSPGPRAAPVHGAALEPSALVPLGAPAPAPSLSSEMPASLAGGCRGVLVSLEG